MSLPRKMIFRRGKKSVFVRNTFGSKEFPPDKEVLVPPRLVHDALAIGVEFVDNDKAPVKQEEPEKKDETNPYVRQEAIEEAVKIIIARGNKGSNRDNFTTAGLPKLSVIAKEAGLSKVGSHEVRPIYEAMAKEKEAARAKQEKEKALKATKRAQEKKAPSKLKAKPKGKKEVDESDAEDR